MKQNYADNVGKSFRGVKGSADYIRNNEYRVIEFLPMFDFGSNGKKPAYKFERVGVGSVTTQACEEFHKNFEAWVDPEAPEVAKASDAAQA